MEELNQVNIPEVQRFILENKDSDITELALRAHKYPKIPMGFVINQINGMRRAKDKLPSIYSNAQIIYPPQLNLEQCSSEITAKYKASLLSGKNLIDLTGGFGVDDFAFAEVFDRVFHCERDGDLLRIVEHNAKTLELENISFIQGDSLRALSGHYDVVYLDPARRDSSNKKVFRFADCEPDITVHQSLFWEHSDLILIKASPLIDIKMGLAELECVKEVHVVSVKNECKEVLFLLQNGFQGEPMIRTINLVNSSVQSFSFSYSIEKALQINYAQPQRFVYEANTSINKAGGFKCVADKYALNKLHPNSHLYTSKDLVTDFPGRIFEKIETVNYSKKEIKKFIKDGKVNLATRNFKVSANDIKKKMGLKDGGDIYAFATTDLEGKQIIILCKKMN